MSLRYRKKPIVIEALQFRYDNIDLMREFCPIMHMEFDDWELKFGLINTMEGALKASVGDYIIKGINGEFYPCKQDIFEKTYVHADYV